MPPSDLAPPVHRDTAPQGLDEFLGDARCVHLIGIGGVGVSGMARVLAGKGFDVRGSDVRQSSLTEALVSEGVDVRIGHSADHLDGVDAVVVSTAIPATNPELIAAQERGIRLLHRAEVLGAWLAERESIGVIGTHGKGTVSSMVSWIFTHAGLDPGFFIGAICHNFGINARLGTGPLIAEVDESDGSLVHVKPECVVLNNLELDHLHYYPTWDKLKSTIDAFFRTNPQLKRVVAHLGDPGVERLFSEIDPVPLVTFGFDREDADYCGTLLESKPQSSRFAVKHAGKELGEVVVPLPGGHNAENALAAVSAAHQLEIEWPTVVSAMAAFEGLENRFTVVEAGGLVLVKDYISHPTGIKKVLDGARTLGQGKLWVVFKPYRFTMIHYLQDEYATCFAAADHVVITRMYTAGEVPIAGVDTPFLADKIRSGGPAVTYVEELHDIPEMLLEARRTGQLQDGDLVAFFGGDDLFRLADDIAERLD